MCTTLRPSDSSLPEQAARWQRRGARTEPFLRGELHQNPVADGLRERCDVNIDENRTQTDMLGDMVLWLAPVSSEERVIATLP
jgi:hypothetical protein